jgi:hypothetical protein
MSSTAMPTVSSGKRKVQPLYPHLRNARCTVALTLRASSCHSMASSIGFSDRHACLSARQNSPPGGRRYFPVSNACKPWKAGASSREKRERLNLRRIDHANPGSMKESGGRWKIDALRGRQLAGGGSWSPSSANQLRQSASCRFCYGFILVILSRIALPNCRIEDRKFRCRQAGVVPARSSWLRRTTSSGSEE